MLKRGKKDEREREREREKERKRERIRAIKIVGQEGE